MLATDATGRSSPARQMVGTRLASPYPTDSVAVRPSLCLCSRRRRRRGALTSQLFRIHMQSSSAAGMTKSRPRAEGSVAVGLSTEGC